MGTFMNFDVFLSHNSKDKPAVRTLGTALKQRGLSVWLDEWELRPGTLWQNAPEDVVVIAVRTPRKWLTAFTTTLCESLEAKQSFGILMPSHSERILSTTSKRASVTAMSCSFSSGGIGPHELEKTARVDFPIPMTTFVWR